MNRNDSEEITEPEGTANTPLNHAFEKVPKGCDCIRNQSIGHPGRDLLAGRFPIQPNQQTNLQSYQAVRIMMIENFNTYRDCRPLPISCVLEHDDRKETGQNRITGGGGGFCGCRIPSGQVVVSCKRATLWRRLGLGF